MNVFNKLFGSTINNVIQEESFDVAKVKHFFVSVDVAEVEIMTHESPRVDIKLQTYEGGPVLETEKTDDTLTITAKRERQIIFNLGEVTKCLLQIHVPVNIADNLDISATSGKIKLTNLLADTVRVDATSGIINIAKIMASKMALNTTSGKIKANELKLEKLRFLANSGNVEMDSVYGDISGSVGSGAIFISGAKGEELELKAGSGKIIVKDVYMKNANLSSTSGKIDAENFWGETTNARVGSGNIHFREYSGSIKGNTNSGNINISVSENSALDLKTGSGSINVEFQEFELNSMFDIKTGSGGIVTKLPMSMERIEKNRLRGKSGNGENLIRLRTGSGKVVLYTAKSSLVNNKHDIN
ncbi:DUF4097 family beta strand repeat-containing protein [Ornithinibacillus sp. 179-J 7C1 HS]|uniref:DUF4097 family beta strand repeat-containing protein n=1 Tax=Ornithinibacillus sp. 179-J 7C1 HS TaxID=3142384 RepID=UPI0039A00D86